jgi:hypothetical protein
MTAKVAIALLLIALMILPAVAVIRMRIDRGRAPIRQEEEEPPSP